MRFCIDRWTGFRNALGVSLKLCRGRVNRRREREAVNAERKWSRAFFPLSADDAVAGG